jgi:hypothetical protein
MTRCALVNRPRLSIVAARNVRRACLALAPRTCKGTRSPHVRSHTQRQRRQPRHRESPRGRARDRQPRESHSARVARAGRTTARNARGRCHPRWLRSSRRLSALQRAAPPCHGHVAMPHTAATHNRGICKTRSDSRRRTNPHNAPRPCRPPAPSGTRSPPARARVAATAAAAAMVASAALQPSRGRAEEAATCSDRSRRWSTYTHKPAA